MLQRHDILHYRGDMKDYWRFSEFKQDQIVIILAGTFEQYRPALPDELFMFEYETVRRERDGLYFYFNFSGDLDPIHITEDHINQLADWVIFYTRIMRGQ